MQKLSSRRGRGACAVSMPTNRARRANNQL